MDENGKKKREWIKTAAIIFLAVMLVLTFFSNTVMNYSLPEVATVYVEPGTITAKIRGTGVVESGDPYEVKVTESRTVQSVAVRAGDQVQKGDVILYLEEKESEELKAALAALDEAKKALDDAKGAYNDALLTGNYTDQDISAAIGNTSVSAYRQQLTAAQNAVVPLQTTVDQLTQQIGDIDAQLKLEQSLMQSAQDRADAAMAAAPSSVSGGDSSGLEAAVQAAQTEYDAAKQAETVTPGDAGLQAAAAAAKKKLDTAKANLSNYNSAASEVTSRSQTITNLNSQRAQKEVELYNATKALDEAKADLEALTSLLGNKVGLEGFLDAISDAQDVVNDAQAEVDELTAKSAGATVTAGISGTVTSVNIVAGNTTSPETPVAVLQPEGKGYTLSFSVTNEQARRLSVGDRAELVNAWRYEDVSATVSGIKPDPTDPGQRKQITFDVTGEVTAGQTLNLSVGQKSANFDYIVPNSAVREDNNGKFILIVESRPSPLGNRYVASRVDVEVLASDDTQSAVSGALYGYEFVITTSTQPVEAGQLVRLANN